VLFITDRVFLAVTNIFHGNWEYTRVQQLKLIAEIVVFSLKS